MLISHIHNREEARSQAYASTQVLPHRFAKNKERERQSALNTEVHPYTFDSNIWTRTEKKLIRDAGLIP